MAVRVQHAKFVRKRLKVAVFGEAGTGKTLFGLSFPRPLVVDMESGTDLYGGGHTFDVVHTTSVADVLEVLQMIRSDNGKTWDTLVIDPATLVYSALIEAHTSVAEARQEAFARKKGYAFNVETVGLTQRDWGKLKQRLRAMLTTGVNLPVHLVLTMHAKDIKETEGSGEDKISKKVGERPDFDGMGNYYPDLVLHMKKENGKFYAVVVKERGGIAKADSRIPNVSFASFRSFVEARETGEAPAVTETPGDEPDRRDVLLAAAGDATSPLVADAAKVQEIVSLKRTLKIPDRRFMEVVGELGAERVEELTAAGLDALLERLQRARQQVAANGQGA